MAKIALAGAFVAAAILGIMFWQGTFTCPDHIMGRTRTGGVVDPGSC